MHYGRSRSLRNASVAAAIAGSLALSATAAAAPPTSDRFPVEAEFVDPALSEACGFEVTDVYEGTFSLRLFRDRTGTITREIDTQPATKVTYRSAWGALTIPFSSVLHTEYPHGAVVGAPAILTITGTGAPYLPGSGRTVIDGVVAAVEDGFPLTRFTTLRSQTGSHASATDEICSALAP